MKKKKPKNSQSKSPQKTAQSSSSLVNQTSSEAQSGSVVMDRSHDDSTLVSEAQIDSIVDAVAQLAQSKVDLVQAAADPATSKTVIVESSTDPSSDKVLALTAQTELSSADPVRSSSVESLVVFDNIIEKTSSEASPPTVTADAGNVSLSSQPAVEKYVSATLDIDVPSQKTVIADIVADPSLQSTVNLELESQTQEETVHNGMASPVEVASKVVEASIAPQMPELASADAKLDSLSSHQAGKSTTNKDATKLGTGKDIARGESSTTPDYLRSSTHKKGSGSITPPHTDVQPDSSDTESSDTHLIRSPRIQN
ncbi:hypothetical protein F2Q68_00029639 [Brassica cretica]|uniref:Uncharacterized protein n=1 Tax=Brassica cretica TaxID=69181 RepID=A0A8S9GHY4_BRACR|nr:hypothetical protein F2Q68_00029639 [Brassica cretica]